MFEQKSLIYERPKPLPRKWQYAMAVFGILSMTLFTFRAHHRPEAILSVVGAVWIALLAVLLASGKVKNILLGFSLWMSFWGFVILWLR